MPRRCKIDPISLGSRSDSAPMRKEVQFRHSFPNSVHSDGVDRQRVSHTYRVCPTSLKWNLDCAGVAAPWAGRCVGSASRIEGTRKRCTTLFALVLGVISLLNPALSQTIEWVKPGDGIPFASGRAIAQDDDSNSYVTGHFRTSATIGSFDLTSNGVIAIFVAKYDVGGNVLWAKSVEGPSDTGVSGIAVDSQGSCYIAGGFWQTMTFGPDILTSSGSRDVYVAKFDTDGTILWARSGGGTADDIAAAIAVDSIGNSFLTGRFGDTADFGPYSITSTAGSDIFVAMYDGNGNVLWANSAGGLSFNQGSGIAVDNAGNGYVSGWFSGTVEFGPFSLTSVGSIDLFVAKYDPTGQVLWVRSAGGNPAGAYGVAISVDAAENSYVTGHYHGTVTFGTFALTSPFLLNDFFVAKYSSAGNVLWARSAGATEFGIGEAIAVDTAGNSYLAGWYAGAATFGPYALHSAGARDIFVAKYDSDGNVRWADSSGGTADDRGRGVVVDGTGHSYVTGFFHGTADFGPFQVSTSGTGGGAFVAKYNDPFCGDGIVDTGEACDGADIGICITNCLSDCTCENVEMIPAVSDWGMIAMALLISTAGAILVRVRTSV